MIGGPQSAGPGTAAAAAEAQQTDTLAQRIGRQANPSPGLFYCSRSMPATNAPSGSRTVASGAFDRDDRSVETFLTQSAAPRSVRRRAMTRAGRPPTADRRDLPAYSRWSLRRAISCRPRSAADERRVSVRHDQDCLRGHERHPLMAANGDRLKAMFFLGRCVPRQRPHALASVQLASSPTRCHGLAIFTIGSNDRT